MLEKLCRKLIFVKFSLEILDVIFQVKHSIGHISGMVGPIDVKQKGDASVGYWVIYMTLTFDLNHDLDLWFFKVKFQKSCLYLRNRHLIDMKRKQSKSIRYWADCMVLPFDHTYDLDLEVSRSKFEIALFQEWIGPIDMEIKGCQLIILDHDLWVTMVRWVDEADRDRGDFKRQCAVDISICNL